ncbi:helix-turn-helix domain-containing protein [Lactococcus garvieae]|uniref:helix-turn-helix domain-containing protein n=1 Tax=Lactococcus garvieae TaxID=1363 RepID=UPI0009BFB119|nr:helix-turn-helix transcriptional regulator [Lactococcus garvieae]QPS71963.1 helix-turn-helix transcriptional regulator [Lactococcus garvieae]
MENQEQRAIIAANIKKYIQKSGVKQKDFAAKIGVVPSTLSDYLNMRIMPSQGVIQRMADFFGVDKSDIDTTYKNKLSLNLDSLIDEALFYKTEVIEERDRQFFKNVLDAYYKSKNIT